MGKRRIRLLKQLDDSTEIVGVDARQDRRIEVQGNFGIKCYDCLEAGVNFEKPNVAFVCSSPLSHYSITKICLEHKISVFSEINLINENHKELIKLAKENNCKLFLSSTPMYRKEIQYITTKIQEEKQMVNYIYHVGQYLPDWHPWENYNDFFVSDKRTNGCREIFVIELPWILEAFGEIVDINVIRNKISNLKIDYPDSYIVTVKHKNGHKGIICVDVVARTAVRKFEVYGEELYMEWLGTPDSLNVYDKKEGSLANLNLYDKVEKNPAYSESIIENMYVDEIKNFFNVIKNLEEAKHSYENDIDLLQLVDKIEGIN